MISIKEKADKYAKEYLFSPFPQKAPNVHFEAGTNYVLECIEESIKNSPAGYRLIYYIIEQLKK